METVLLFAFLIAVVGARLYFGLQYAKALDAMPEKERQAVIRRLMRSCY